MADKGWPIQRMAEVLGGTVTMTGTRALVFSTEPLFRARRVYSKTDPMKEGRPLWRFPEVNPR